MLEVVLFFNARVVKYPLQMTFNSGETENFTENCTETSPGVYSWIILFSTPPSPANQTHQCRLPILLNPQRSTRVSLTSVLTSDNQSFVCSKII